MLSFVYSETKINRCVSGLPTLVVLELRGIKKEN
jgi:hypothetical protein